MDKQIERIIEATDKLLSGMKDAVIAADMVTEVAADIAPERALREYLEEHADSLEKTETAIYGLCCLLKNTGNGHLSEVANALNGVSDDMYKLREDVGYSNDMSWKQVHTFATLAEQVRILRCVLLCADGLKSEEEAKPASWDECWQESKRMVDDILGGVTGNAVKVY